MTLNYCANKQCLNKRYVRFADMFAAQQNKDAEMVGVVR